MTTNTAAAPQGRRSALQWLPLAALLAAPSAFAAEITLPPISVGAGARTSFTSTDVKGAAAKPNDFALDSVRLYITGSATDYLKLTFNTEYTGSAPGGDNKVQVMDAIARFEFSPHLNIWAGRFLPPSDRSNLYGPYYANHWGVYRDGVQDGYANVAVGRDNGVAYWGDFGNFKISAGLFDVPATTDDGSSTNKNADKVISAGRLQYDFWDQESGYFLNSTYYGEKNLLAVGAAAQNAGSDTSFSFDFLLEKNFGAGGVLTIESEYTKYKGLTGSGYYGAGPLAGQPIKSSGGYGLVSYLFPQPVGIGKLQVLGKYAEAVTDVPGPDPKLKTTEANLGYIVKAFNLRGYLFYIDQSWEQSTNPDAHYAGVGLQVQI